MKTIMTCSFLLALFAALASSVSAYAPHSRSKVNPTTTPMSNIQKAITSTFVATTIASNAILPMGPANAIYADTTTITSTTATTTATNTHILNNFVNFDSSSNIIAEKVVREGLYKEYEIDVTPQTTDNAQSTFKSAKETKSKKGKYTALLAVLIVGSFVIPMAQYFWYVRDDDSTEKFFGQKAPEPEPVKKKKGWF